MIPFKTDNGNWIYVHLSSFELWPHVGQWEWTYSVLYCALWCGRREWRGCRHIWKIIIASSLKFVLKGPISNLLPLIQIMAWHWAGDKPLFELMMPRLLKHICVTQPQWVNQCNALIQTECDTCFSIIISVHVIVVTLNLAYILFKSKSGYFFIFHYYGSFCIHLTCL